MEEEKKTKTRNLLILNLIMVMIKKIGEVHSRVHVYFTPLSDKKKIEGKILQVK